MKRVNRMKKAAALGAAVIMAVSLAACSGGTSSSKEASSSGSAAQETKEAAADVEVETQAESKLSVVDALMGDETDETEYDEEELILDGDEEGEVEMDEETFSGEADDLDFNVFSSEKMGFSFLYEPVHTAYITENGAAQLAINGDESVAGLSVTIVDSTEVGDVASYIQAAKDAISQKHGDAMDEGFEDESLDMEEHDVTGFEYDYDNENGEEVECTWFIEESQEAAGKYIVYETASRDENDNITLEALSIALESLVMEPGFYGESQAVSGSIQ